MASTYIPQVGGLLTRGLFACRIDPTGASPKADVGAGSHAVRGGGTGARARGVLAGCSRRNLHRTLPEELKTKLAQKNLGLDYRTLDRAVAKGRYQVHRFPERLVAPFQNGCASCPTGAWWKPADWRSSRSCIRLRCRRRKARRRRGTMDVAGGEVLACQIVNSQRRSRGSARRTTAKPRSWWAPRDSHHGCAR